MKISLSERLLRHSIPVTESGCVIWLGYTNEYGYGKITINDKSKWVHRVAYEEANGGISRGLDIDHLCRVRCCINPSHLEAVTRRVNLLRGNTRTAMHAAKMTCKRGHPFADSNLRVDLKKNGLVVRQCKECDKIRQRARYIKKKVVRDGEIEFNIMDVVV